MQVLLAEITPLCGIHGPSLFPNSCNVNLYEAGGSGVGWHEALSLSTSQDARVTSLSLGQERSFEIRSKPLNGQQVQVLSAADWTHSLGKKSVNVSDGIWAKPSMIFISSV